MAGHIGEQASLRVPARRFRGVEGLRALAAGGVLFGHVHAYGGPYGSYDLGRLEVLARTVGMAGVVLFFTLSGFLLYRPFAAAVLTGSRLPSVRSYLRSRFLRIFPAYWLAVLVLGVVLGATYLPAARAEGRSLASDPEALAANLLLVQGFFPSTMLTGIGPAWSLAVELVFYLALPLLALVALALSTLTGAGRRRPWLAALAPAGMLLVLGQVGYRLAASLPRTDGGSWHGSWSAVVTRSFLAQCGLFAAGLVLAVVHTQLSRGALVLPAWWRRASGAGAVVLVAPPAYLFDTGRLSENRATLMMSIGFALLLALVVLPDGRSSRVGALLDVRVLQWGGLISYGVFLWHEPLIWVLQREGLTQGGRSGFLLALLSTTAVSVVAATVSWRCVERPALALKRSPPGVEAEAGPGAATGGQVPAQRDADTSGLQGQAPTA